MWRAALVGLGLLAAVTIALAPGASRAQLPPSQIACGTDYGCQLRACRRECHGNALCRRLCARRWDQCLRANGCDFVLPSCANALASSSCDPTSPSTCATVRLVNRTGSDVTAIRTNDRDSGLTLAAGATASILVDPARDGLRITAESPDMGAGAPCTWSVTRAACLNETQVVRVVFRRGNSSCRAATPAPY